MQEEHADQRSPQTIERANLPGSRRGSAYAHIRRTTTRLGALAISAGCGTVGAAWPRATPEQLPIGHGEAAELPKAKVGGDRRDGRLRWVRVGERLARQVHAPQPEIPDRTYAPMLMAQTRRVRSDTPMIAQISAQVERSIRTCRKEILQALHHRPIVTTLAPVFIGASDARHLVHGVLPAVSQYDGQYGCQSLRSPMLLGSRPPPNSRRFMS